jgi:hypothetical protein
MEEAMKKVPDKEAFQKLLAENDPGRAPVGGNTGGGMNGGPGQSNGSGFNGGMLIGGRRQ